MRAQPLAEGITRLPTMPWSSNNGFLVEAEDDLILIDPGFRLTAPLLERMLHAIGHDPADVGTIVLTHAHLDHAGAAARLARGGARVLVHPNDAGFVRDGRQPEPEQRGLMSRIAARLPVGFPGVEVQPVLHDRTMVGPLRVLHTPGHTPGHVSLLHEATRTLLVGDALINPAFLRYPFAPYCSDLASVRASAERLGELDIDTAGFAHGPPLRSRARERILRFLAGRR